MFLFLTIVSQLYAAFKKYVLNDKQLDENGFPREHPTNSEMALLPNRPSEKKKIVSCQISAYSFQKNVKINDSKSTSSTTNNSESILFEVTSNYQFKNIEC